MASAQVSTRRADGRGHANRLRDTQLAHRHGFLKYRHRVDDVVGANAARREVVRAVVVSCEGAAELLCEVEGLGLSRVLGWRPSALVEADPESHDPGLVGGSGRDGRAEP